MQIGGPQIMVMVTMIFFLSMFMIVMILKKKGADKVDAQPRHSNEDCFIKMNGLWMI